MPNGGSNTNEILPAPAVTGFLAEIGKKLADRWLNLLVLPGALWVVALIVAIRLGSQHPFDIARLRTWLNAEAAQPGSHSIATVILAAAGLLAAAAAAGLLAFALGAIVQRAWGFPGYHLPLTWVVGARQQRWSRRRKKATETEKQAIRIASQTADSQARARASRRARAAEQRLQALGESPPERPTWIAERFYQTARRTSVAYGLDLGLTWPRLWTVLPETLRTDLTSAQDTYAAAARLIAWGVPYILLAIAWWPASVIGVGVVTAGWLRGRAAAAILADLIETATDLYGSDLAAQLGISTPRPFTAEIGHAITGILRQAPLAGGQVPAGDPRVLPP